MISIVVPVYKVEQYLPKCLDSIINQTYRDIEIILVDDGSPDNCPAICDDYARRDNRFKVLHKKNGGLSDARNAGINIASGEYIIFLDSDDWLKEESIGKAAELAEKTLPDIIIGNVMSYDINQKESGVSQPVTQEDMIERSPERAVSYLTEKGIFWPAFRLIVKRNFLVSNDLFFLNGILHEDLEWVPRAVSKAEKFALLKEPFYCYRSQRKGSITDKKGFMNFKDMLRVSVELYRTSVNKEKVIRDYIMKGAKTALLLAFEDVSSMKTEEKKEFKKIVLAGNEIVEITKNYKVMKNITAILGLWKGLLLYAFLARVAGNINKIKRGLK